MPALSRGGKITLDELTEGSYLSEEQLKQYGFIKLKSNGEANLYGLGRFRFFLTRVEDNYEIVLAYELPKLDN